MPHSSTCACDDIGRHGASACSEPQSRAHRRCQTQGFEVPPRLPSAGQGFLAFDLLAFVRFLYFLARKRAMAFCAAISQEYPSRKELRQQCGAFFYQHRSRIGFLRVLGFCRCPRRCLSINRILSLASSQACALVCVGGFGASEGSAAQVLLLHVVKLPFKERGRMAFRMTLMRTWEARDNRFALLFRCLPLSSALRCV